MTKGQDVLKTTVDRLNSLGLPRMAAKLEELYESPDFLTADRLEQICSLVSQEYQHSETGKLKARLRKCGLWGAPEEISRCVDSLDRAYRPSGIVSQLSTLSFVGRGLNVLVLGASDAGKTYFAKALAIHASSKYKGEYLHCSPLIDGLVNLKRTNFPKYEKRMRWLARCDFLVIDDFLITPLASDAETSVLFTLLESRAERLKSTILCSQRAPEGWSEMLMGDKVATDAITKRASRNFTVCISKPIQNTDR